MNLRDRLSRRRALEPPPAAARPEWTRREGAERATFAAGCFWGVEAAFREVEGVLDTVVGYTGGDLPAPSYKRVCRGDTGHAEAVEVWFDPTQVTYTDLLETFWLTHDPTTRDRQGWDIGSQYRSAIFHHGPRQEALAIASREKQEASLRNPIVTQIATAPAFYRAEDYHQRYFEKQGRAACAVTIR
jgi:peptide-methionine (S)-S-oxide reductase